MAAGNANAPVGPHHNEDVPLVEGMENFEENPFEDPLHAELDRILFHMANNDIPPGIQPYYEDLSLLEEIFNLDEPIDMSVLQQSEQRSAMEFGPDQNIPVAYNFAFLIPLIRPPALYLHGPEEIDFPGMQQPEAAVVEATGAARIQPALQMFHGQADNMYVPQFGGDANVRDPEPGPALAIERSVRHNTGAKEKGKGKDKKNNSKLTKVVKKKKNKQIKK